MIKFHKHVLKLMRKWQLTGVTVVDDRSDPRFSATFTKIDEHKIHVLEYYDNELVDDYTLEVK